MADLQEGWTATGIVAVDDPHLRRICPREAAARFGVPADPSGAMFDVAAIDWVPQGTESLVDPELRIETSGCYTGGAAAQPVRLARPPAPRRVTGRRR